MKRSIILCLFSLLTVIVCFSQNTYPLILNDSLIVISPTQLKQTNLIFLEHRKLSLENRELKIQNKNYGKLISNYQVSDSVKNEQISLLTNNLGEYNNIIEKQRVQIEKLQSSKKLYKGIAVGGVTISLGLLILLIVK